MPKPSEYVLSALRDLDRAELTLKTLLNWYTSLNSSQPSGAESSPTPSAEHAGGGSAPQTTGLTAREMRMAFDAAEETFKYIQGEPPEKQERSRLTEHIARWLASGNSATGGEPSQPPLSDAQRDNWLSVCYGPTSTPAPSVPTTTTQPTDLSAVLRMAEELRSGAYLLWEMHQTAENHEMSMLAEELRNRLRDLSRPLT